MRARKHRFARFVLLLGGEVLAQPACTSQTAVTIVAPVGDAAGNQADTRPGALDGGATAPDVPDAAVASPDSADGAADVPLIADAAHADAAPDGAPDAALDADAGKNDGSEDPPPNQDGSAAYPLTLFSDDFSGGYEVNWSTSESSDGPITDDTTDGGLAFVTLDSSQTDYSRLRCNLKGDKFTNPTITASMSLRIETAPSSTRFVRLDVRQSADTANIFYAVGASIATDGTITHVSIFKKVPDSSGNYTICELKTGADLATPVAMNTWRTIKLSISGTTTVQLAAYFQDKQMATYTDDCTSDLTSTQGVAIPNGGCLASNTGLGIQVEKGIKASVDNVLVTTP